MEVLDTREFLVLNALYLRKIADTATLAECSGCSAEEVESEIAAAVAEEQVLAMGSQYVLADPGRRVVLDHYDEAYRDLRAAPEVEAWYERFEKANDRFLQLVSAWQIGNGDDAGDQPKVYERLARVVERHVEALHEAAEWLPRYRNYAERFERGLELVDAGRVEYVTSPTVDSLHNIWFEFHEDILALLGRPRETVSS